ncbi:MAG TPA: HAD hydrolase-like protein [Methanoregula sp.]|nr:HAD hydrolase-like protein [Methanoregula sp.]
MNDFSPEPTTLLFDMDNTLFDLVGAQIASCREVARFLGHDDGDDLFGYFLRPARGFESPENIRDYMRDRHHDTVGTYRMACRIYEQVKMEYITPYEGVPETLGRLSASGYRMAIVTDAPANDAALRLEKIGLLSFFPVLVAHEMTGRKKPALEPFLLALEMMDAVPNETVLIGDSPRRDIGPGHALGMTTVYARYGDRFSNDRIHVGADFTIDRMDELSRILAGSR